MAERKRRAAATAEKPNSGTTLVIVNKLLDEVSAYDNNPRQNAAAIPVVKESIAQFGFRVPIVIDSHNVIVAGHTRVLAMKELRKEHPGDPRFETVPCLIAGDLTDEQLAAFRLVDNKTAQVATWDMEKLSTELSGLLDTGIDFTGFGWTQEELDCLTQVVSDDCLTGDGVSSASHVARRIAEHRDGRSVRISIADVAFYVLREDFDEWLDAMRRRHHYDNDAMLDYLAAQMGLFEAKKKREQYIAAGAANTEAEEEVN